jgi:uncharacterized membrane protein
MQLMGLLITSVLPANLYMAMNFAKHLIPL